MQFRNGSGGPGESVSPETYFGAARNTFLGNGIQRQTGLQHLSSPPSIDPGTLYLVGDWNFSDQYTESAGIERKIIYKYRAKSVYFVASAPSPVTITILRDGKPLRDSRGADVSLVSGSAKATVHESRLYKIVEDTSYGEHTLEVIVSNLGFQAFTFG